MYDAVGDGDTEVIPELAGVTLARTQLRLVAQSKSRRARRLKRSRKKVTTSARQLSALVAAAISDAELQHPDPTARPVVAVKPINPTPPTPSPTKIARLPRRRAKARDRAGLGSGTELAAAGLALVIVAMICSSIRDAAIIVPMTAILGFGLALAAIQRRWRHERPLLVPSCVAIVAGAVVSAAIWAPAMLGSTYESAQRKLPKNATVEVLPHPQFIRDPDLRSAEWVDASKAAVALQGIRVEVISAEMGRVQTGATPGPAIIIMLRLSGGDVNSRASESGQLRWDSSVKATLSEPGSTMQVSATAAPVPRSGPSASSGVAYLELLVALEFPIQSASAEFWRLELPASAWGGDGTVRFALPHNMIRKASRLLR